MNGPRFQRVADNVAGNARMVLLVLYRVALAVLFGPPAMVYAMQGQWVGAAVLVALAFALGSVASAE